MANDKDEKDDKDKDDKDKGKDDRVPDDKDAISMAQVTVSIPDAVFNRVLDAFVADYGYDITSGQTKAQFLRACLAKHIKEVVRAYEIRQATQTAGNDAGSRADGEINPS